MMRQFKVVAIRTDEYVVELDDSIYNEEWLKEFSAYMHPVDELKDLVNDLAHHQLRVGSDYRFIEGFGNVTRNGKLPFSRNDFDNEGKWLPEDQREKPAPGINIKVISEDEDYEFEINEEEHNDKS